MIVCRVTTLVMTVTQKSIKTETLETINQLPTTSDPIQPEPTPKLVKPPPSSRSNWSTARRQNVARTTSKPKPKREPLSSLKFLPEVSARRIEEYHRRAEEKCLEDFANDTHAEGYYCPCLPPEFSQYMSLVLGGPK